MNIRKYRDDDAFDAAMLIRRTYGRFNRTEGTKKAVQRYVDHFDPKKNLETLRSAFKKNPIFLVAEENGNIIGLVRGRADRVTNMFVSGVHHRKGIGTKLMAAFEKIAASKGSKMIRIRSSLYAVPFYRKLGYRKTTGVRGFKGLKMQPVIKHLKRT